jgi:hypothetical protein
VVAGTDPCVGLPATRCTKRLMMSRSSGLM